MSSFVSNREFNTFKLVARYAYMPLQTGAWTRAIVQVACGNRTTAVQVRQTPRHPARHRLVRELRPLYTKLGIVSFLYIMQHHAVTPPPTNTKVSSLSLARDLRAHRRLKVIYALRDHCQIITVISLAQGITPSLICCPFQHHVALPCLDPRFRCF